METENITLTYRPWKPADEDTIAVMMQALYREDPEGAPLDAGKIKKTFQQLRRKPDLGTILVLEMDSQVVGYSLLINFWSNEWGGIILHIDELYLDPGYRNQGIGSDFIRFLHRQRWNQAVALALEVVPSNVKAKALYQRLGFLPDVNSHWFMIL